MKTMKRSMGLMTVIKSIQITNRTVVIVLSVFLYVVCKGVCILNVITKIIHSTSPYQNTDGKSICVVLASKRRKWGKKERSEMKNLNVPAVESPRVIVKTFHSHGVKIVIKKYARCAYSTAGAASVMMSTDLSPKSRDVYKSAIESFILTAVPF
uniref:Uncharacterized protein n=1 Tax=Marseillevirus LCMAC101 TaxID=2506602 RepID=A0A481YS53_9VIRU|nr:MAG: hypothetical protein LCMAC101_06880 [Marseillevirus LCMAC101]